MAEIDWARLRAAANEAMAWSYSPYSNFPVGAAALVDALTSDFTSLAAHVRQWATAGDVSPKATDEILAMGENAVIHRQIAVRHAQQKTAGMALFSDRCHCLTPSRLK